MGTRTQKRTPAGSPDGGKWALESRPERDLALDAAAQAANLFGPQGDDVVRLLDAVESLTEEQRAKFGQLAARRWSTESIWKHRNANARVREAAIGADMGFQVWQLDQAFDAMADTPPRSAVEAVHAHMARHLITPQDYDHMTRDWSSVMGLLSPKQAKA